MGTSLNLIFCEPINDQARTKEKVEMKHIPFSLQSVSENHTYSWPSISSVQLLSRVRLFATQWITARQASLSITNSRSLLKLMSIESVMQSKHLILYYPFSSHLHSFPVSGSFSMSQLFTSGSQSIGVSASASVFPMNIQDWFPLGLTGWISLHSKGFSRVFSNTTVQKHQFFGAQLSYRPTLTSSYAV